MGIRLAGGVVGHHRLTTAALAVALTLLSAPAWADGTGVSGGKNGFNVAGHSANHAVQVTSASSNTELHVRNTSCLGDGACTKINCGQGQTPVWHEVLNAHNVDVGQPGMICLGAGAVSVGAAVERAFRRIPVPTPTLHIQPVKGRTLVNFDTNYYATGGASFTRAVTLLGHRVTLRIHVDHYLYRFGDGEQLSSASPGAAFPQLTNTHQYRRRGVVHPNLATTWSADYQVDGGGWRAVRGTVTTTGPTQRLEVVTATPRLTNPYE
ncbi:MAG TPA: hypothetical protein VJ872_17180 [Nocardioides sp.]|nr:hypothetical protein [Nocardioides sp.]